MLKVLGSPAVPALSAEDSPCLHTLRSELETHEVYSSLVEVARGTLSWSEYVGHASNSTDNLTVLFEMLIAVADLVCTTPALSEKDPYHKWKTTQARGIVIDEAANMSRADLYCVW